MEPDSIAQTSHLERLPPELTRMILSQVSDLTTLRCAILSCRFILNSFIATRVLFNELDSCDVRPETVAVLMASRLVKPARKSALNFYKAHLQERNANVGILLTLDEVDNLSKLHSAISRLVKDFTDFAEPKLQKLAATTKDGHTSQPQLQPLELSTLERNRIMRTLYIFEIYFNVFRQVCVTDAEVGRCMNEFLLNFAHWEIEQLACVQEFLFFQISPTFNEMARHDVYWGSCQIPLAQWIGNSYIQSLYFKGLVALEKIAKAKTYDRQREVFYRGQIPETRSHYRFLHRSLKKFNCKVCDEQAPVSNYDSSRDYALEIKRPYFEDTDDGPFSIWKWAHESASLRTSVFRREQADLRKWGYVMWDRARLDTLPIFRGRWQPPGPFDPFNNILWSLPDDDVWVDVEGVDERWRFSWSERKRLYGQRCKGWRGWWDINDTSKLVWESRKYDTKASEDIPTSLSDAKRIILALKLPRYL